jgi:hypothetical protein
MSNEWRRAAAVLSDERRREVWARAVLGLEQPADRITAKALRELRTAGLLDDAGQPVDAFGRLLAATPALARTGVDRWLVDGRIDSMPSRPADRRELLDWVAARIPGRELTESELGEHLAPLTGDVATLRRYLVDHELLGRTPDGSAYRVIHP